MDEEPKLTMKHFIQDITLPAGRADDEASGDSISDSAKSVLEYCVVWKGKGGTIVNFSKFFFKPSDNLSLAISNQSTTLPLGLLNPGYSLKERSEPISTDHSSTTGRFKNLRISIWKYEPHVDCNPHPSLAPSEESCDAVLALVPSYDKVLPFAVTTDWHIALGRLPRDFYLSEYLRLV